MHSEETERKEEKPLPPISSEDGENELWTSAIPATFIPLPIKSKSTASHPRPPPLLDPPLYSSSHAVYAASGVGGSQFQPLPLGSDKSEPTSGLHLSISGVEQEEESDHAGSREGFDAPPRFSEYDPSVSWYDGNGHGGSDSDSLHVPDMQEGARDTNRESTFASPGSLGSRDSLYSIGSQDGLGEMSEAAQRNGHALDPFRHGARVLNGEDYPNFVGESAPEPPPLRLAPAATLSGSAPHPLSRSTAETVQLETALRDSTSQLSATRVALSEIQSVVDKRNTSLNTEFEHLVERTRGLLEELSAAKVRLLSTDFIEDVPEYDGLEQRGRQLDDEKPRPGRDLTPTPVDDSHSRNQWLEQQLVAAHSEIDLLTTRSIDCIGNGPVAQEEVARLNNLVQDAYAQLDQATAREAKALQDLAESRNQERELSILIASASVQTGSAVDDDSSALQHQLSALNSRMEDFVFNLLEKLGTETFLDGRMEHDIVERILRNPAFRGYAGLAVLYGEERVKAVTLSDFLMAGFVTVILRTVDRLVFRPFKIGLNPEEDRYLTRLYASMSAVSQDRVSKWRFVTYQALPTVDEASFSSAIASSLLEHFESVLNAIFEHHLAPLGVWHVELANIIQEAIKWRNKTRGSCVGDYEAFLELNGGGSRRSTAASGYKVEADAVTRFEKVVGFRAFGLLKIERTTAPGTGGRIEPQEAVLLAGVPITEAE